MGFEVGAVTTTSSVVVESPKRRKVEAGESESPPSAITELNRSSLFIPPSRKEKKDSAAISRLSFQAPSTACSEEECFKSADLNDQVTSVRSARQAVDALNAEGPDIDIILMEADLPTAKGMKLLKHITRDENLQRIPVISCYEC